MPGTVRPAVDLSDPMQVAVKVTTIEGALALLSQQVSQGLGNVTSQLSALQGDMRDNAKQLAALSSAQHEFSAHSTGLERLAEAIENSTKENMEWRRRHETENNDVSSAVQQAKGALWLLAFAGMAVVGLVVFTVQSQFEAATRDRQRIEKAHDIDVARIEKRMDLADADRKELKNMRGLK